MIKTATSGNCAHVQNYRDYKGDEVTGEVFTCAFNDKGKLSLSSEQIAKLTAPKIVPALYNAMSIGPRLILRGAIQLLRANIVTRLLSVTTLVIIDTVCFSRKWISGKQYIMNVVLALTFLVGGTYGWYLGVWFAGLILLEGLAVGIIMGIIGAALTSSCLGFAAERFLKRITTSDTDDVREEFRNALYAQACSKQLSTEEIECVEENIKITQRLVRKTIACRRVSGDSTDFVQGTLSPVVEDIVCCREGPPDF